MRWGYVMELKLGDEHEIYSATPKRLKPECAYALRLPVQKQRRLLLSNFALTKERV
jgi:hypothetical protein